MLSPELSENIKQRLKRADEAIHEYEAQQQIIWILIERLGGSILRRNGVVIIPRSSGS